MWWNFVGRTHEEITAYREAWQREIGADSDGINQPQFGTFPPDQPATLPAPALPNARLRPASNNDGAGEGWVGPTQGARNERPSAGPASACASARQPGP